MLLQLYCTMHKLGNLPPRNVHAAYSAYLQCTIIYRASPGQAPPYSAMHYQQQPNRLSMTGLEASLNNITSGSGQAAIARCRLGPCCSPPHLSWKNGIAAVDGRASQRQAFLVGGSDPQTLIVSFALTALCQLGRRHIMLCCRELRVDAPSPPTLLTRVFKQRIMDHE